MTRQALLLSVLAGLLVIAMWWLFVYSAGQDELARIDEEVAAAEAEGVSLQQRVASLEAVRSRAPETEAAIARLQSVVPDDPALPSALRQIEAAADDAGVTITAVSTARPTVVDEAAGLYASALSFSLNGSYFQVVDFLRRLEDPEITSRGVVIDNVTFASAEYPLLAVSMTGQMFSVLEPPPTPAAVGPGDEAVPTEEPTGAATEAEDAA